METVVRSLHNVQGRALSQAVRHRAQELQIRQFVAGTLEEEHGQGDLGKVVCPLGSGATRGMEREAHEDQASHAFEGLPFVCWGEGQTGFPEARWEHEVGVDPVARADVMTTRLALAQAGVGAIQLTRDWGRQIPGLVEIETEPQELEAEVWLVTHRTLREVPRVRAVWDWIAEEVVRVVD